MHELNTYHSSSAVLNSAGEAGDVINEAVKILAGSSKGWGFRLWLGLGLGFGPMSNYRSGRRINYVARVACRV